MPAIAAGNCVLIKPSEVIFHLFFISQTQHFTDHKLSRTMSPSTTKYAVIGKKTSIPETRKKSLKKEKKIQQEKREK